MPEPMDRETFLARVAARLDMPHAEAQAAIDELRGHLEDAAADRRARGESMGDAERHAVARFGDPELLGRELTRTYRAARPLLAIIGGSVRAATSETARAWMQVLIVMLIAGPLGLALAGGTLHALGREYGSMLTGPVQGAITVALGWLGFAAVGWALPGRITDLSGRDHTGVRRGVAVTGLVVSSVVLWLVVDVRLDALTAIGLPLAPVVFALVALGVPAEPRFRVGIRETLALGGLLVLPVAVLAIVTATEPRTDAWSADLGALGVPAEEAWSGIDPVHAEWMTGYADELVDVSMPEAAAGRLQSVRVEVWPVVVEAGVMRFGPTPLATAVEPAAPEATVTYDVPTPRRPVDTVRILVGVEPDGTRVLLDQDLAVQPTPPWDGTLAEWWFGP